MSYQYWVLKNIYIKWSQWVWSTQSFDSCHKTITKRKIIREEESSITSKIILVQWVCREMGPKWFSGEDISSEHCQSHQNHIAWC